LGPVDVDIQTLLTLENDGMVRRIDRAHELEHSLEVHLPFLQQSLEEFSLIPLVVGDASPFEVARVLDWLWGGDETLVVISSDLSHYHAYAQAQEMDRFTSTAIEQLDSTLLHSDDACGARPIKGLLLAAQEHHLQCTTVDVRNSGDISGDLSRVVGYGAYLFH
jgi:MEMO1 family protein